MSRPRASRVSPSGVSASRRVVRSIRRTPSRSSSRDTILETAEAVSPRSAAAAAKLPRSITRTKVASSSVGVPLFMKFRQQRWPSIANYTAIRIE
jgi:hypothetical protein